MDYVVIDIETTGLNCHVDKIIEIGAVKITNGIPCAEFATLINPERRVGKEITDLTGITDDMLLDQPLLSEIVPELELFIDNSIIVAHNAQFDKSFLQPIFKQEYHWLDTIEFAKVLLPYEINYSLNALTNLLGSEVSDVQHRALADARATGRLFLYLQSKLEDVDIQVLEVIYSLCKDENDPVSIHICDQFKRKSKIFGNTKISSRSLVIAVPMKDHGLIFNESIISKNNIDQDVSNIFDNQGPLSKNFDGYEYRPQQIHMATAVSECLKNNENLIIEAGTGTGKSLAYLLPAVMWALNTENKVVISTHTINLQEQLLSKDIPKTKEVLDVEFNATVVKGKSHYICLRKWKSNLEQRGSDMRRFLMRLVLWLSTTQTGDCSELHFSGKEKSQWRLLATHSETCFGSRCKFFRGPCFVSRAKKRAELSDILIVNHSLLMSDAAINNSVLPDYKYLIIDEAHHLEKVAEDHLGARISYYNISTLLSRLNKRTNAASGKLLENLLLKVKNINIPDENIKISIVDNLNNSLEKAEECYSRLLEFYTTIAAFLPKEKYSEKYKTTVMRILPTHRKTHDWHAVVIAGENLLFVMKDQLKYLLFTNDKLTMLENQYDIEISDLSEMNLIITMFKELIINLTNFLSEDQKEIVCWLEYSIEDKYPILYTAPAEVKKLLNEYIFEAKSSVVLTSATLTVNNKFDFFKDNIGIELSEKPVQVMQLDSPFNYQENVLFAISTDIADPTSVSDIEFTEAVANALIKMIKACKGRTMVLFTSHYQLKQVFEKIRLPLKQVGITVLAHGLTGNRGILLEQFKNNENSVILGANSFWEGVDVVGEALSSVIIVKLPFWPPNIPTVSARLERYKDMKIDGFRYFSLPQAIIRFKQGFGRLIRSKSDYGVITILDKRIIDKYYGNYFINSLPKVNIIKDNIDELSKNAEKWLHKKYLS